MTFIRLREINKQYANTKAVIDLNLDLPKSEITVLLGRSGCGKTTTLRLIAGLEKPDAGSIWIGDDLVSGGGTWKSATQRQIGMVFQDYALFPHMNVAKNIGFGISEMNSAERKKRIADLLDLVGLSGKEQRFPHELSGGQQQRVALARALAPSPEVILLDEPFSNLDATLRQTMREDMRRILHESGVTTVFVTHDQEEALRLADELVIMDEGHVLQSGAPEDVYRTPASLKVAQFLAKVNVVDGFANHGTVKTSIGNLWLHDPTVTGPVDVVLFPESILVLANIIGSVDLIGNATVEDVSYFGFHQMVTVRLEDGTSLQARTWSHRALESGQQVHLTVETPVVAFPKI